MISSELKMAGIAAAVVVVGGLVIKKQIENAGGVGGVAQAAAGAVVDAAGGAVAGTAIGIGDVIGVPRTELNACELAIKEGRTWDASFACPAGRFLEYVTSGK